MSLAGLVHMDGEIYVPPRLSREQIFAIEYLVAKSEDATELTKKVVIWLIRQTNFMTEQVVLSLPKDFLGNPALAVLIHENVHDMCSCNGDTHIYYISMAAGTKMCLRHCCRSFHSGDGAIIWWSFESHFRNAKVLTPPTQEELDKIDLKQILSY